MQETLITFETAKLAKEKGFDLDTYQYYTKGLLHDTLNPKYEDGSCMPTAHSISSLNYNSIKKIYSAPTQSLLQKWLREVHNIDIQVLRNKPGYTEYKVEVYKTNETNTYIHFWIKEGEFIKWFRTYEEALEVGLQQALKLI